MYTIPLCFGKAFPKKQEISVGQPPTKIRVEAASARHFSCHEAIMIPFYRILYY